MNKEILNGNQGVIIDTRILRLLALNSKFQRSDLRIYLFLLSLDRPIYQRELIELADKVWASDMELHLGDQPKKSGDFRAEVICRSIKNLVNLNLVKQVKKEGNNKFFQAETNVDAIFKQL